MHFSSSVRLCVDNTNSMLTLWTFNRPHIYANVRKCLPIYDNMIASEVVASILGVYCRAENMFTLAVLILCSETKARKSEVVAGFSRAFIRQISYTLYIWASLCDDWSMCWNYGRRLVQSITKILITGNWWMFSQAKNIKFYVVELVEPPDAWCPVPMQREYIHTIC
jgi:hypothetical protein